MNGKRIWHMHRVAIGKYPLYYLTCTSKMLRYSREAMPQLISGAGILSKDDVFEPLNLDAVRSLEVMLIHAADGRFRGSEHDKLSLFIKGFDDLAKVAVAGPDDIGINIRLLAQHVMDSFAQDMIGCIVFLLAGQIGHVARSFESGLVAGERREVPVGNRPFLARLPMLRGGVQQTSSQFRTGQALSQGLGFRWGHLLQNIQQADL